jgi:hypothetical protein
MSCCPHCSTPCAPSDILSANGLKWLRCGSCLELTDCSALEMPSDAIAHESESRSDDVDDNALTIVYNPVRAIVKSDRTSGELIVVRPPTTTSKKSDAKRPRIVKSKGGFSPKAALPAAPAPRLLLPKAPEAMERGSWPKVEIPQPQVPQVAVAAAPRRRRPPSIPPLPVHARFPSQPRVSVAPPARPSRPSASTLVSLPQMPPPPRPRRPARKLRLPGESSRPRDAMLPDSLFLVPSLARFFAPTDRHPPPPAIRSSEIHPLKIALASGLALIAIASMLAFGKHAMAHLSASADGAEQRSSVNASVPAVVRSARGSERAPKLSE